MSPPTIVSATGEMWSLMPSSDICHAFQWEVSPMPFNTSAGRFRVVASRPMASSRALRSGSSTPSPNVRCFHFSMNSDANRIGIGMLAEAPPGFLMLFDAMSISVSVWLLWYDI